MTKKRALRTGGVSAKTQRAESLAEKLGVSPSSVWFWRRTGRLPKNPVIRAAYLKASKAIGLSKEVAK